MIDEDKLSQQIWELIDSHDGSKEDFRSFMKTLVYELEDRISVVYQEMQDESADEEEDQEDEVA